MDLYKLTLCEAAKLIKNKEISSKELAVSIAGRINDVEDNIKSFITIDIDLAIKQAKAIDKSLFTNDNIKDITGIPYGIKDNICTKDIRTTCASKMLEDYVPEYDAYVVERIKADKGVYMGKLNLDSFAIGSSGETSYFQNTRNPWNLKKVPGGSSGGSAASVAADEVMFSLGSDTGGSIRQPAAFCGIVGMKPTYGLVSRYGLVAFASSLDQIGPLTKNVQDCAIVLNILTGYDKRDSTSIANYDYPDYKSFLKEDVKDLRIAIPEEYLKDANEEVISKIKIAARLYEDMGAKVEEISLPLSEFAVPVYFLVSSAEGASNLARYDGIRYGLKYHDIDTLEEKYLKTRTDGFGSNIKHRVMIGNFALDSKNYKDYYLKAIKVRTLIRKELNKALESHDLILSPTTPEVAYDFGTRDNNIIEVYKQDTCTVPANLAGLPAMSIPCGFDKNDLPIGMQLMSRPYGEGTLLRAAYSFEKSTDYHKKRNYSLEV